MNLEFCRSLLIRLICVLAIVSLASVDTIEVMKLQSQNLGLVIVFS